VLHLIPDDGRPHAPTAECGCDPQLAWRDGREVLVHADVDDRHESEPDTGNTDPPWETL
jgi:hypothetical protein